MATGSEWTEIANAHVPLAFLLGRRASEYNLPTLATSTSGTPRQQRHSFELPEHVHVRRREQQAKLLLERVLSQESRAGYCKPRYESGAPLPLPLARVTSADRGRRAHELQRVLDQLDDEPPQLSSTSCSGEDPIELVESTDDAMRRTVNQERHAFAATHGFVPRDDSFVEVIGSVARIQRAQSLRHFHEDAKYHCVKQFKAKQTRQARLREQLLTQQADMKARNVQAKAERRRQVQEAEDCESNQAEVSQHAASVRAKQSMSKRWHEQQQQLMEKAKSAEQSDLLERQRAVQRNRCGANAALNARLACSSHEKKTMASIKGVGPSFQSTLRVDLADEPRGDDNKDGRLLLQTSFEQEEQEDSHARYASQPRYRLHERQYDIFLKSQLRSLHLGGGFASKPRNVSVPGALDEHSIETRATALTVEQTRRDALEQWKKKRAAH